MGKAEGADLVCFPAVMQGGLVLYAKKNGKRAIVWTVIAFLIMVHLILTKTEARAETMPWQTEKALVESAEQSFRRLGKAIKKTVFPPRCAL